MGLPLLAFLTVVVYHRDQWNEMKRSHQVLHYPCKLYAWGLGKWLSLCETDVGEDSIWLPGRTFIPCSVPLVSGYRCQCVFIWVCKIWTFLLPGCMVTCMNACKSLRWRPVGTITLYTLYGIASFLRGTQTLLQPMDSCLETRHLVEA